MIVLTNSDLCSYCRNSPELDGESEWTARLVFEGLHHAVVPERHFNTFPDYLQYMKSCDSSELTHNILQFYRDRHDWRSGTMKNLSTEEVGEKVLQSPDDFIAFLLESFDAANIHEDVEREAYLYLKSPDKMRDIIYSFIAELWESRFQQLWEENRDDLSDFIDKTDLSYLRNMTPSKAVSHMTGSEILEEKIAYALQRGYRLVFVPNRDVGEVYSKMISFDFLYIFFNPENYEKRRLNAQLDNLDELARKLGAVSDPNRLKILKYIAGKKEACSQNIIKNMGFSQSAVSRHLKALSDSGILIERRQVSAKFYRLNGEYIHNILHSLTGFLGI